MQVRVRVRTNDTFRKILFPENLGMLFREVGAQIPSPRDSVSAWGSGGFSRLLGAGTAQFGGSRLSLPRGLPSPSRRVSAAAPASGVCHPRVRPFCDEERNVNDAVSQR